MVYTEGKADIIMGRINPSGTYDWIYQAHGTGSDDVVDLELRSDGSIVLSGVINTTWWSPTATDTIAFDGTVLINDGFWQQAFVAAFDPEAGPTAVTAISAQPAFSVYPNPSGGASKIQVTGEVSSIELYDILGHRIYDKQKLSSTANEINIQDLTKGAYFIKANCAGHCYTKKIIVN
jgi:hypothetical protein